MSPGLQFSGDVRVLASSSGQRNDGRIVAVLGNPEQSEQDSLEVCEFGRERLDYMAMGVDEVSAGEAVEDLEDPHRARRCAGTVLGVEGNLLQTAGRHGPADLELNEGVDEECYEVARHESLDAGRVVEEHGGDELVTLQLVMAALEAGCYVTT